MKKNKKPPIRSATPELENGNSWDFGDFSQVNTSTDPEDPASSRSSQDENQNRQKFQ